MTRRKALAGAARSPLFGVNFPPAARARWRDCPVDRAASQARIDITSPSSRSASETRQAGRSNLRIASLRTRAPPTITSWRPSGSAARLARSATDSFPSISHQRSTASRDKARDGSAPGRTGRGPAPGRRASTPFPPDRPAACLAPGRPARGSPRRLCRAPCVWPPWPGRSPRAEGDRRRGTVPSPDTADVQRDRTDLLVGFHHQFGRATADVDDHHRPLLAAAGRLLPLRRRVALPPPPREARLPPRRPQRRS